MGKGELDEGFKCVPVPKVYSETHPFYKISIMDVREV